MAVAKVKNILGEIEGVFGYVKGTAKWAKVLEVGQFGSYSVDLYGEYLDEIKDIAGQLQRDAEIVVKEAGKKYQLADLVKENDDGEEYVQFKLPENKYDGTPNKITIYDAFGNKQDDWDKLIGNGSTVKIKYMMKPYYMNSTKMVGVSYKFYAVQVIDLKEYQGKDEGFGDESADGFGNTDVEADIEF